MVNPAIQLKKLPSKLRPVSDEQDARAAVALLIKPVGEGFEILLVKRTERRGDPWSGQMALPGGKCEPQDKDLKATVTRETLEETGIDVSGACFLGVLKAGESVSKPGLVILPFVILLGEEPRITLSRDELDSYIWVPYRKLIRCHSKAMVPRIGEVYAFIVDCALVWGITHDILEEFFEAFKEVQKK
jgi:8-oxo-dGTP pyrophosphatase MutT (NUDIX family)